MTIHKPKQAEKALQKKSKADIEKAARREELPSTAKDLFKDKYVVLPTPICAGTENSEDKILFLKMAMRNPGLWDELIDEILSDLIVGAYQDRMALNAVLPTKQHEADVAILRSVQRMRQSADNHLLNIIRAIKEIKRPPIQVVVKQAEQVNVGEQINQGDQQVNIAKNEQLCK